MWFLVYIFVFLTAWSPSHATKSTGVRAKCEEAIAGLRERITVLTRSAQSGDATAREALETALAPALGRYARYYHRLLPSLSEQELRSVGRNALHVRLAGAEISHPRTREYLSGCIGRAMRQQYHAALGVSEHEQAARIRMDELQKRLTDKAQGRPPNLSILAAAARVSPEFVKRHLTDASVKAEPPGLVVATGASGKEAQVAAIDEAKSHAQTQETLGLLILKLRKLKLNDVTMVTVLEREGVSPPPGVGEWSAELIGTLPREIWKKIVSVYPEGSLASRGAQNQLIVELANQGFSFRTIAELFDERQIPSPKGVGWSHTVIARRYREAARGIFIRSNVPEQMGWHGELTSREIDALVARVNSEDDPLTEEELIMELRRHQLSLRAIADHLNQVSVTSTDATEPWKTGTVNNVIHQEQNAVVQEFLTETGSADLISLRRWCERFDSVSIAPRESSLLITYLYPEYGDAFSDRAIAHHLSVRSLPP